MTGAKIRAAAANGNGIAPPNNPEIEKAILGALFWMNREEDRARFRECMAKVDASDFYATDHRRAFLVLAKMAEEGLGPDSVLFPQRAPDLEQLAKECVAAVPSPADFDRYLEAVRSAARARRYLELVRGLEADLRDPRRWSRLDEDLLAAADKLGPAAGELRTPKPLSASLVLASQVAPRHVDWIWYPYLPRGKICFLSGDPGDGKTLFAIWLAAHLTRGRALPGHEDDPEPPLHGNVIYMSNEDGLEDTLVPRLIAAGADLGRVVFCRGRRELDENGQPREVDITLTDVGTLESAIAQSAQPLLLVIDPLQAFLDAGVDMNRANEVRGQLRRLVELADRHNLTILILRHRGKSLQTRGKHSGIGSIDFTGIARSELITAEDQKCEGKLFLCHSKSNVAKRGETISYEIRDAFAGTIETAVFAYGGTSPAKLEDILNPSNLGRAARRREDCEEWLREQLAGGPIAVAELVDRAEQAGFSERTLRRACKSLGVDRERVGGFGQEGRWTVRLPDEAGERKDLE